MEDLYKQWLAIKPVGRFEEYLMGIKLASGRNKLHMEFGVWKGGSINYLAQHLKPEKVYGFDSFEGLPEDWSLNEDGSHHKPKGHFATPLPKVRQNVELIVGWFDKTLPGFLKTHPGEAGYINIDSDLYSSAKYVLTTLNDRIVPGTIIRFDEISDWGGNSVRYGKWREGEWRALEEWLKEFNREVKPISRTSAFQGTLKVLK